MVEVLRFIAHTDSPLLSSCSIKRDPIKPVPPVTNITPICFENQFNVLFAFKSKLLNGYLQDQSIFYDTIFFCQSMSLTDFFTPVNTHKIANGSTYLNSQLGSVMTVYETDFPDLSEIDIAIFGVADDRKAVNNQGCAQAADAVRSKFYFLHQGEYTARIADLGNIQQGHSVSDTYAAVKTVVSELVKMGVMPVIIGGGQDITYAQYLGYETLEQRVDLVVVDSSFDLHEDEEEPADTTSTSYLNKILLHEPNYLFNYSNIGYQSYFVNRESLRMFDKLLFDVYRLGTFSGKIEQAEPVLRNADMISFDMGAIRSSDAFANANASPNGFYG